MGFGEMGDFPNCNFPSAMAEAKQEDRKYFNDSKSNKKQITTLCVIKILSIFLWQIWFGRF